MNDAITPAEAQEFLDLAYVPSCAACGTRFRCVCERDADVYARVRRDVERLARTVVAQAEDLERVTAERQEARRQRNRALDELSDVKDEHAVDLATLRPTDDPMLDATDGAHPAWWRGHDHAAEKMREALDDARLTADRLLGENTAITAEVERLTEENMRLRAEQRANHAGMDRSVVDRYASAPEDRAPLPANLRNDPCVMWHPELRAWGTYAQGDAVFYPGTRSIDACVKYRDHMTGATIAVSTHPPCVDAVRAESLRAELARVEAERDRLQRACDEGLPREVIHCPACKAQHLEGPRHDNPKIDGRKRPHHDHRCYACGHIWHTARWSFGAAEPSEEQKLREAIAGRTVPPTELEIAAHAARGGRWLVSHDHDCGSGERLCYVLDSGANDALGMVRRPPKYPVTYVALDRTSRPCPWPVP
jgi:hypothetical protein